MASRQDKDEQGPERKRRPRKRQAQSAPRDIHEANIEDLLAQLFDGAENAFAEARHLSDDRDSQIEVLMQAASLAKAYGQLLTVRNRHRKALDEEG